MSVEENKAIVRRFFEEGWNGQNPDRFDELMDERYAAFEREWSAEVWAAYPDSQFELPEMIAEGDKVVTRVVWTGTHTGAFWGAAPTGNTITVNGVFFHRMADGRIQWDGRFGLIDLLSWQQQLGLVDSSAPPPP